MTAAQVEETEATEEKSKAAKGSKSTGKKKKSAFGGCQVQMNALDLPSSTGLDTALTSLSQGCDQFAFLKKCFLLDTGAVHQKWWV